MRKKGRRPKLTEEFIVQAGKLAEAGNFDITIHQALGVTGTTWYRWLADGERVLNNEPTSIKYTPEMEKLLCDFYYTIRKAQAVAEVELLGYIQKEAKGGTWQAAAWILERKYRTRWAREVSGDGEDNSFDKFLEGVDEVAEENDTMDYVDPLEQEEDND